MSTKDWTKSDAEVLELADGLRRLRVRSPNMSAQGYLFFEIGMPLLLSGAKASESTPPPELVERLNAALAAHSAARNQEAQ